MRPTRIALTTAWALALAAPSPATAAPASAATAATAPASASAATCAPPRGPLLGIARVSGTRTLARFAPRTLRPLRAPRVPLPLRVDAAGFAFSPGCDAVALPVRRGRILLVDLERGRTTGSLTLAGRPALGRLAWPRAARLTGFSGPFMAQRAVTVSVPDGRVVASHRIDGRPWVIEPTSLGLVALTGPVERIGPAALAVAAPDGGFLRVPLPRIRTGYAAGGPSARFAREVAPGLAVDEARARAYVVAADRPLLAEVDLSSGAVSYHVVRALDTAAPVAREADRLAIGPYRIARWMGDGTIAVAGGRIRPRRGSRRLIDSGQSATRIEPDGLSLIRTRDWSMTTLDPLVPAFAPVGDVLVGMRSAATPAGAGPRATGLAAFGTGGSRAFARLHGTRPASLQGAAWPYAYVTARFPRRAYVRRTYVVDVRSGRTVNAIPARRPPALLAP